MASSADMLPPGILNEENICFASCILQCLFNQPLYKKVISDLEMAHVSTCDICKQGYVNFAYSTYLPTK